MEEGRERVKTQKGVREMKERGRRDAYGKGEKGDKEKNGKKWRK